MTKVINKKEAITTLYEANRNPNMKPDKVGTTIDSILRGSNKTYRYILVTALLAKSTNEEINILSLQAKDKSEGAYDARSLCHHVIVPFERDVYPGSLGLSNEPFLNKPARFPRLSINNAVRKGKDFKTLKDLINILSQIKSKDEARIYLESALYSMKSIYEEIDQKYEIPYVDINDADNPQTIMDYISELIGQSHEGEICPLVVSAVEHLYYNGMNIIVPHKVNESGASSKEIGDIDIFDSAEHLISSIEVKDKDFSKEDVEHAITKFAHAHIGKSLFIFGRNVDFDKQEVYHTAAALGKKGYFCSVISVLDFVRVRLYSLDKSVTIYEFVELMMSYARKINVKNETIEWIKECLNEFGL